MRAFVGAHGVIFPNGMVMCLFVNGLGRRAARLAKLFAAIEAGTLRPREPRPPAGATALPRAERSGGSSRLRLPSSFGWLRSRLYTCLGRRFDCAAYNGFTNGFENLLADPKLRALCDQAPDSMGPQLRGLCQILGVKQPDWLRLARRRRTPKRKPPPPKHPPEHAPHRAAQATPPPPPSPRPRPSVVVPLPEGLTEQERQLEIRRYRLAFKQHWGIWPLLRFPGEPAL
ncbi:MAG: hypothetical protein JOY70_10855 [Acidisphaera sp.]|nr:hypothetical protein [Acidisphaera sp.]MBV9812334.1 hypothetical protein [Acetobacteraceae bacterium]